MASSAILKNIVAPFAGGAFASRNNKMDGGGMPVLWVVAVIFVVSVVGFFAGRARALQSAGGDARRLHSLPIYYGSNVALWAIVPAAAALIVWLLMQPIFVNSKVIETLPASLLDAGSSIGLVMSDVRRVADGLDVAVAQAVSYTHLTLPTKA